MKKFLEAIKFFEKLGNSAFKIISEEKKIILVENEKILLNDDNIKTLDRFLSNIIKTLGIPKLDRQSLTKYIEAN